VREEIGYEGGKNVKPVSVWGGECRKVIWSKMPGMSTENCTLHASNIGLLVRVCYSIIVTASKLYICVI
jgi:hypothetical protein